MANPDSIHFFSWFFPSSFLKGVAQLNLKKVKCSRLNPPHGLKGSSVKRKRDFLPIRCIFPIFKLIQGDSSRARGLAIFLRGVECVSVSVCVRLYLSASVVVSPAMRKQPENRSDGAKSPSSLQLAPFPPLISTHKHTFLETHTRTDTLSCVQ